MNDAQKKDYIAWLNDAHAMEEGLIKELEKQINATEKKPEMQSRLQLHLDETRRHAELVRSCLKRHGTEPSTSKDITSKISAIVQGAWMSLTSDEMVKNFHSSYVAEHFEIASYTVIRAAAEELGDTETVEVCETILADEVRMAEWVYECIPSIVFEHLRLQE